MTRGWLDDARQVDLMQVAVELGIERHDRHHLGPCPSCNESTRSSTDRRAGPLFTTAGGRKWCCSRCNAHGDSFDLVRLVVGGDWPEVRAWFSSRGWCQPAPDGPPAPRVKPRPVPPVRERPPVPVDEVRAFWDACPLAGDDPAVAGWLRARGVEVATVEDRSLARALPSGHLPPWCSRWPEFGARCVVPVFGEAGDLVTLRGRVVRPQAGGPKVLALRNAPTGVLADGTGRALLRGDDWLVAAGVDRVFVTEGEPDWLLRACWAGEAESAPVVLGITGSKAWPAWLASRIPDGWTVQVDGHRDEPGDRLVQRVAHELMPRCAVERTRIGGGA